MDFDKKIKRVTAGEVGESFLIIGSEKTAIVDTGAAYCAPDMIKNIERELGSRPLDYVLATHSHFDHIGAVAYIRERWPDVKVMCGTHAASILSRPNARALIRKLSESTQRMHDPDGKYPPLDYNDDLLVCDVGLNPGDTVNLGDITVRIYDASGHTKCSVGYHLEELDLLFMSESVGVVMPNGFHFPSFITSYDDAMATMKRFKKLGARYFIPPHTPRIMSTDEYPDFLDNAMRIATELKERVLKLHAEGLDELSITRIITADVDKEIPTENEDNSPHAINMAAAVKKLIKDFA